VRLPVWRSFGIRRKLSRERSFAGTDWQLDFGDRHAVGRRRPVRLGHGRFIADSWFSDEPLPEAYTHRLRRRCALPAAVSAATPDRAAIDAYLAAVDIRGAIRGLNAEAAALGGMRGEYLAGLACASRRCGIWPWKSSGAARACPMTLRAGIDGPGARAIRSGRETRARGRAVGPRRIHAGTRDELLAAVDAWRKSRGVSMASIKTLGHAAVIGYFDGLSAQTRRPASPAGTPLRPARQHRFPAHPLRLVFGFHELSGPRAAARRRPGI